MTVIMSIPALMVIAGILPKYPLITGDVIFATYEEHRTQIKGISKTGNKSGCVKVPFGFDVNSYNLTVCGTIINQNFFMVPSRSPIISNTGCPTTKDEID